MKIKAIFVTLNVVLGIAFLVIFLTPVIMLGGDWSSLFWSHNWPVALVFLAALGAVDAYFLINWSSLPRAGEGGLDQRRGLPGEADFPPRLGVFHARALAPEHVPGHLQP